VKFELSEHEKKRLAEAHEEHGPNCLWLQGKYGGAIGGGSGFEIALTSIGAILNYVCNCRGYGSDTYRKWLNDDEEF